MNDTELKIYNTIDSTQTEAKRLIDNNKITNKLNILAFEQTNGITRKENIPWHSPKGNIYFTKIINIEKNIPNTKLSQTPLCTSLAIIDFYLRWQVTG